MLKSRPSVPVAVEETYQIWLWLDAHVANLPARVRAATGRHVLDTILDVLKLLTSVSYEPRGSTERPGMLRRANQQIAFLRLLLRGLRDRRQLGLDQHAHVAKKLDAVGRMVGAWAKAA